MVCLWGGLLPVWTVLLCQLYTSKDPFLWRGGPGLQYYCSSVKTNVPEALLHTHGEISRW
jgi:hypothetical protein